MVVTVVHGIHVQYSKRGSQIDLFRPDQTETEPDLIRPV
jgi:hypothetical protein